MHTDTPSFWLMVSNFMQLSVRSVRKGLALIPSEGSPSSSTEAFRHNDGPCQSSPQEHMQVGGRACSLQTDATSHSANVWLHCLISMPWAPGAGAWLDRQA